jgi:DNA-binding response OmpR family regulator
MTRHEIEQRYDALETAYSTNASLTVLAQRTHDLHKAILAAMGEAEPPVHWKLSPVEIKLARELAQHDIRSTPQLVKAIYGSDAATTGRTAQNVYVFVHRLRKKLEKFGIEIGRSGNGSFSDPSFRGGYYVTPETVPTLRAGLGFHD